MAWAAWVRSTAGYWPFSGENLWQYVLPLGFLGWLASACLGKAGLTAGTVVLAVILVGRLMIGLGAWTRVTVSSLEAAVQIALVWGVPAVTLGFFLPLLARPSDYRWLWGPLAAVVALVSMVLVLQPWMIAVGVVLIGAGVLLQRTERIESYGPLLAACAAMAAFAGTTAVHRATGLGISRTLNTVINPAPIPVVSLDLRDQLATAQREADPAKRIAALRALRENAVKTEAAAAAHGTARGQNEGVRPESGEGREVREPRAGSASQRLLQGKLDDRGQSDVLVRSPQALDRPPLLSIAPSTGAAPKPVQRQDLASYLGEQLAFELAMLGYDPAPGQDRSSPSAAHPPAGEAHAAAPAAVSTHAIGRAHTFELATTGSITFWITMGLLAAWQRYKQSG